MQELKEKLALFNPELPLEKASTIPGGWYWDSEIDRLESRSLFRKCWLAVGRTDQVAEPGSFFTVEIAGESILVVRDKENTLRAFSNICRHRAARVTCKEHGKASFFQCRYHGWTYDLTGRLKGAPEFDGVVDFEREKNGLPAWSVETWGPLVFVHGGENPSPLSELTGPLNEQTRGLGLEKMQFARRTVYDLKCNWKIFVDNYLDGGYHVNTLHPSLGGVINYKEYRTEIHGKSSVQISPLRARDVHIGDISVSAVRSGDAAYYWWLHPNLMLNIYEGLMDTNIVFPMGPDRCRVVFDYYFSDANSPEKSRFIDDSIAVAHQVQLEDVDICEEVQHNLMSETYQTGRFSVRREAGGYHFHRLLARALQS